MALGTPTVLSTIGSATDANAYTGSSGTPGNNELLIACVGATQASAVPTTPTVANTPWGLTWTRDTRGDNNWGGAGAVQRKGWIFYAVTDAGTSYSADTFDVAFGGVTQTGCTAIVLRISGAKLTTGGLDALVQMIITADSSTPYAAGPLSAAGASGNRPLAFYAVNSVTDIIHDSAGGWTEPSTVSQATPTVQYAAHWNATTFDTTPTATTGINQTGGQWAIEIAEAVGTVHEGEATPQGVATFANDGSFIGGGDASLQSVATFAHDGSVGLLGESSLTGVATFTSDGLLTLGGDVSATGVATFTSDGDLIKPVHEGEASLTGVATFTSDGFLTLGGDLSAQAVATFTSDATFVHTGDATFQGVAASTVDGSFLGLGDAAFTGVATYTSDGTSIVGADASLQAVASLSADGDVFSPQRREVRTYGVGRRGGVAYVSRPRVHSGVAAAVAHEAEASLQAVATFAPDGAVGLLGDAPLQAVASFTIDAILTLQGDASQQAVATFTADGDLTVASVTGEATLQGVAQLGPAVAASVEASTQNSNASLATSQAVNIPDGSNVVGKMVVAIACPTDTPNTVTWPAGWTEFGSATQTGGGTAHFSTAWHIVDGSEGWDGTGDTITVTLSLTSRMNNQSFRLGGTTTAPQVSTALQSDFNEDANPPNLAPSGGSAAYLFITGFVASGNTTGDVAPSGYANLLVATHASSLTSRGSLTTAYRSATTAAEDPGVFGTAGDITNDGVTFTIAISPVGAGVPGFLTLQGQATQIAVATYTSDGLATLQGEASLQGVAVLQAEAGVTVAVQHEGEASLIGVAVFQAEAAIMVAAETILVGVAHMGFDPSHEPKPTSWYPGARGPIYGHNRRRVRGGGRQTTGRRVR